MKIALLHPNNDTAYQLSLGYESTRRPPETALAVLDAYQKEHARGNHKLLVLNPDKSNEELATIASDYDLLGFSDWYSNHRTCTEITRLAKRKNPNLKTVFGGPNATLVASQTMQNHSYIDYIVSRDGERTFVDLLDEKNPEEIPNLWYRTKDGSIKKNFRLGNEVRIDLDTIPLWDFSGFEDTDLRLSDYTRALKGSDFDPWKVPPISVNSMTGCIKAMSEQGPCKFCYENSSGRTMSPERFWKQITYLDKLYAPKGIPLSLYVGDDIFTISSKRIKDIAKTKPSDFKVRLRAYGYLPHLAKLPQSKLEQMALDLKKIGVFNLFFGSEHYNADILKKMNKQGVSIKEAKRVMQTLFDCGEIRTTMAYLLGYSGETKKSLNDNLVSLEKFAQLGPVLERVYFSRAIPWVGTVWGEELKTDLKILKEYQKATKKDLTTEDYPDYDTLSKLVIENTTGVSERDIEATIKKMRQISGDRPQGGFLLESER